MDEKFELAEFQKKELRAWIEDHRKTCPLVAAKFEQFCGGCLRYTFEPTAALLGVVVRCACGAEVDLTDYEGF
jgi:hypothetical protein